MQISNENSEIQYQVPRSGKLVTKSSTVAAKCFEKMGAVLTLALCLHELISMADSSERFKNLGFDYQDIDAYNRSEIINALVFSLGFFIVERLRCWIQRSVPSESTSSQSNQAEGNFPYKPLGWDIACKGFGTLLVYQSGKNIPSIANKLIAASLLAMHAYQVLSSPTDLARMKVSSVASKNCFKIDQSSLILLDQKYLKQINQDSFVVNPRGEGNALIVLASRDHNGVFSEYDVSNQILNLFNKSKFERVSSVEDVLSAAKLYTEQVGGLIDLLVVMAHGNAKLMQFSDQNILTMDHSLEENAFNPYLAKDGVISLQSCCTGVNIADWWAKRAWDKFIFAPNAPITGMQLKRDSKGKLDVLFVDDFHVVTTEKKKYFVNEEYKPSGGTLFSTEKVEEIS